MVKPHSNRYSGYYRRIFNVIGDNYRHRGRGESTSGSVTNQLGDRLKMKRIDTTTTRILARIIAHTAKTLIRTTETIIRIIIRYAPQQEKLK